MSTPDVTPAPNYEEEEEENPRTPLMNPYVKRNLDPEFLELLEEQEIDPADLRPFVIEEEEEEEEAHSSDRLPTPVKKRSKE